MVVIGYTRSVVIVVVDSRMHDGQCWTSTVVVGVMGSGGRKDGTNTTPSTKIHFTHKDARQNNTKVSRVISHDDQHEHVSDPDDSCGQHGA